MVKAKIVNGINETAQDFSVFANKIHFWSFLGTKNGLGSSQGYWNHDYFLGLTRKLCPASPLK
jgi:hypothetical protein